MARFGCHLFYVVIGGRWNKERGALLHFVLLTTYYSEMVGDIFGGNASIILYSSSYVYVYLVQFESSGISGKCAQPPEHFKQWQEQSTSQLSVPVQGLVKRATMSRRSARIISKSSKAVKGEEHDDEIKFEGSHVL